MSKDIFSAVFGGVARETKEAHDSKNSASTHSSPKQKIPVNDVTDEPVDSCSTCERSRLVDDLESQVDELTRYAAKAEETKDSLRRLEDLRKHLAYLIFGIIAIWLVAVFGLVFLGSLDVFYFQGDCTPTERSLFFRVVQTVPATCKLLGEGSVLKLSEKIVIALITTTTINVLGLAYIVARWLYPDPNGKKKKKDKAK